MRPTPCVMRLALGATLAFMVSCRDSSTAAGTALFVSVEFEANVQVTQLRFSASIPDRSVLMQVVRPEIAGAALSSPQTLRIRLPDGVAGELVTISVGGLQDGRLVASGDGQAVARQGVEVDLTVVLEAHAGVDGGQRDGGRECVVDGGVADTQTDPDNCGQCGNACPTPLNARAACSGGSCGRSPCAPGFFDIDGENTFGCEATCSQRVCTGSDGGSVTVSNDPLPETGLVFQTVSSGSSYGAAVQTGPANTNIAILGEPTPPGALGAANFTSPTHQLLGGFSAAQDER